MKTAGPGQGSMSGEQVSVPLPQAEQLKLGQQHDQPGVISPGSPEEDKMVVISCANLNDSLVPFK